MASVIRLATPADAPLWLDLVRTAFGDYYPAPEIYDVRWIGPQLDPKNGVETWVAEESGQLMASISFLKADGPNINPVAHLGRNLFRPESIPDGSAEMLLRSVDKLISQRSQMAVVRIPALDNCQQTLFEELGYVCVGFQPLKHMLQQRMGMLFYMRDAKTVRMPRYPFSESLPQVSELGLDVLTRLELTQPPVVRDGVTGYPLQSDLTLCDATLDDYELGRVQAECANPPVEISGRFNRRFGLLRLPKPCQARRLLAQSAKQTIAGLTFFIDEHDRCARITDAFCADDLSPGALLAHCVKQVQQRFNVIYTEVDILATAPRLLKSAEQLGFVPVAYFPAFFCRNGHYADVVKMVKLNVAYSLEENDFTSGAHKTAQIIDRNFEDQKFSLAITNLLRPLSMFAGVGDGELGKIARLFVQKLFRTGDQVFAKGDACDETYLVLRGKIALHLDRDGPAIAQLGDGKIFGELAFLDSAPRTAFAVAIQPSVLLVIKRAAFLELLRREPALGLAVMRNLASDLALKLRTVNDALSGIKRVPVASPQG